MVVNVRTDGLMNSKIQNQKTNQMKLEMMMTHRTNGNKNKNNNWMDSKHTLTAGKYQNVSSITLSINTCSIFSNEIARERTKRGMVKA